MPKIDFSVAIQKLIFPFVAFFGKIFIVALLFFLALLFYAQLKYRFPLRITPLNIRRLRRLDVRSKIISFLRWKAIDLYLAPRHRNEFKEFGLTLYCGRQGSGKTISMIFYANWVHFRYPKCIIVSNFSYKYADRQMSSWRDFFEVRNGKDGVLFLIDEIHSEYSSEAWRDFPEDLLSEISQQRKQRIKIVATAQLYGRVVKQIREQTKSVVQCSTVAGRWTRNAEFDAKDYDLYCNSMMSGKRLKPIERRSFVQSDGLRRCYDTYEKIKRLEKMNFIKRDQRGVS